MLRLTGFIGPKGSGKDTAAKAMIKTGKLTGRLQFAGPLKKICAKLTGYPSLYFEDPYYKDTLFTELTMEVNGGGRGKLAPVKLDAKFLRLVKNELPKYVSEFDTANNQYLYNVDRVSIAGLENRVANSPRELMQLLGTDLIRDRVYKDWHLLAAFSDEIIKNKRDYTNWAVTDIRFKNELLFLQQKFGDAFVCFYVERPEAEEQAKEQSHSSEKEVLELKSLLGPEQIIKNDGSIEDFQALLKDLKVSNALKKEKVSKFVYGPRK